MKRHVKTIIKLFAVIVIAAIAFYRCSGIRNSKVFRAMGISALSAPGGAGNQ